MWFGCYGLHPQFSHLPKSLFMLLFVFPFSSMVLSIHSFKNSPNKSVFISIPCSWVLQVQKLRTPLLRTERAVSKASLFTSRKVRTALHASPTARNSAFPVFKKKGNAYFVCLFYFKHQHFYGTVLQCNDARPHAARNTTQFLNYNNVQNSSLAFNVPRLKPKHTHLERAGEIVAE